MTASVELIDEFEVARPRLLSLAHRILGSIEDAEDAVQAAWLRVYAVDQPQIDNPPGWFTTVTARLCLDQLRSRERRGELPLLADAIPGDVLAADEEYLRREDVSRALLVLLARLTPAQRVAYVLHDLFRVPFGDVAVVLDTTPANAKKSASRARQRLEGVDPAAAEEVPQTLAHWSIVEAFLAAARGGRIDTLVTLMAPDVVRVADRALLPEGGAVEVIGNRAVAEETRYFGDRVHASIPMLVNGAPAAVIAPGGHPLAVITFDSVGTTITRIAIASLKPTDQVEPRRTTDRGPKAGA
ncbi:sigma-70 family RNA polymerase sigma factor [Kribbella italica]|uniref:RNA polymerase sigma-70 factor (ECF subfamily) n=1 Tax=Kribbella italica TaxID=1540520 RepID=A0A7W9J4Z6_9ACTN|nr:RNA polymerase sigma-70 factor (ECF subfamily) [Kribbella italica]